MNLTAKKVWSFEHRGVSCEIVFWVTEYMTKDHTGTYPNRGIYNSYFYIRKDKHPELFDRLTVPVEAHQFRPESPVRYSPRYSEIPVDMSGGVTFYEYCFLQNGDRWAIKIGNDYNHIWNGGENEISIKIDLEETVDKVLQLVETHALPAPAAPSGEKL